MENMIKAIHDRLQDNGLFVLAEQTGEYNGIKYVQFLVRPLDENNFDAERELRYASDYCENKLDVLFDSTQTYSDDYTCVAVRFGDVEQLDSKIVDRLFDKLLDCGDWGDTTQREQILTAIQGIYTAQDEIKEARQEYRDRDIELAEYEEIKAEQNKRIASFRKTILDLSGNEFANRRSIFESSKTIDLPILSSKDESIAEHFKKFMKQAKAKEKAKKKTCCCG